DLQIASRYFLIGKLANALLIIAVFYVGGVLLAFYNSGKFIPLLFLQAIFVSAGAYSAAALYSGCDSGVSARTTLAGLIGTLPTVRHFYFPHDQFGVKLLPNRRELL